MFYLKTKTKNISISTVISYQLSKAKGSNHWNDYTLQFIDMCNMNLKKIIIENFTLACLLLLKLKPGGFGVLTWIGQHRVTENVETLAHILIEHGKIITLNTRLNFQLIKSAVGKLTIVNIVEMDATKIIRK